MKIRKQIQRTGLIIGLTIVAPIVLQVSLPLLACLLSIMVSWGLSTWEYWLLVSIIMFVKPSRQLAVQIIRKAWKS